MNKSIFPQNLTHIVNEIINDVIYIFLLITYLRYKKRLFEATKALIDYSTPSSRSKNCHCMTYFFLENIILEPCFLFLLLKC